MMEDAGNAHLILLYQVDDHGASFESDRAQPRANVVAPNRDLESPPSERRRR